MFDSKISESFSIKLSVCILIAFAASLFLISCGDDDSDTTIQGTVGGTLARSVQRIARDHGEDDSLPALSGVQVCCFGECGTSDADGFFIFGANAADFAGGDVLCNLSADGLDTPIVIPEILPNPVLITLRFDVNGELVTVTVIDQTNQDTVAPPAGTAAPTALPQATATSSPGGSPEPTATPDISPTLGPTSTPDASGTPGGGCLLLSGQYTGNGGCGLGSTISVSVSGSTVTLSSLGSNGATDFNVDSNVTQATSSSSNLILFGKAGHSCTLNCDESNNGSFTLGCADGLGGSCSETFS